MPQSLIEFAFRYFAFIGCGMTLINLWAVRSRASQGAKIFLASFSGMFLTWGILQVLGGYKTFFFILLSPADHPLAAAFWIIYFVSLWGCTVWVIWGKGASELLQSGLVHGEESLKTPQAMKLFFATISILFPLLVALGYASGFFSRVVNIMEQTLPV